MHRYLPLLLLAGWLTACDDPATECGPGTTEVEGECLVSETTIEAHCGFGTSLHWSLRCRPTLPTAECGAGATGTVDDGSGHTICVCVPEES